MKDDYLWDRSGEPDPEVDRLESALARYRYEPGELHLRRPAPQPSNLGKWLRRRWVWAAASLSAATAAVLLLFVIPSRPGEWEVSRVAGVPRVDSKVIRDAGSLAAGDWLRTDESSRARVDIRDVGTVGVEPGTEVRLVKTGPVGHLLELKRGTISAAIWAPPGEFAVETPSALAVDLGCAYTLHVDDSGAGVLRATLGWVGFKFRGRESFIPAGAVCETQPGLGPGMPYFEDASREFKAELAKLDFESLDPPSRAEALGTLLREARKRDALTLWHLLARAGPAERGTVYDRLAALVPPPPGASREAILSLDRRALDLWWEHLGYGEASLWRIFQQSWRENSR